MEITDNGAAELAGLIAAGELTPTEVSEAFLDRIEALDDRLHSFLTVEPETVLAEARSAEQWIAAGEPLGPLHGVPVAVKDLEETKGLRTTFGAAAYGDNVPSSDSLLVQRLRAAGAIVLGKTNTPAFGLLGETKNRLGPDSVNPWNTGHATGGSSGGSAACVAARMAPLATGTDAAGSITGPAANCGVFGFKPTLGRIPIDPNAGDSLSFNAAGPISRNVADAALFLTATAGYSSRDPIALRDPTDDYVAELGSEHRSLRVAFSPDFGRFPVDAEVAKLCREGAEALAELGSSVRDLEVDLPDPWRAYLPIYYADAAVSIGDFMREHRDELYPETIAEFEAAGEVSGADVSRALHARHAFRAGVDRFFDDFDLLITPATATAAFPLGELPDTIGGQSVRAEWQTFMPFSIAWNLLGNPTASVPCGLNSDGLPVGMLLVGRRREDLTVLRAAATIESARPWGTPPI